MIRPGLNLIQAGIVEAISGKTTRFREVLDEVTAVLREMQDPPVDLDAVVRVCISLRLRQASTGEPCNHMRSAMRTALDRLAQADVPDAVAQEALEEAEAVENGTLVGQWAVEVSQAAPGLLAALLPDDEDDVPDDGGRRWLRRYAGWLERQDTGGSEVVAAARAEAAGLRGLAVQDEMPGIATSRLLALLGTVTTLARLTWIGTVRDWWMAEQEKIRKEQQERVKEQEERRAGWRSPSLPLRLSRHISTPPREASDLVAPDETGWSLAPSMPADTALTLGPLTMSGGRALLRQIPSIARLAAIDPSGPVVLWEDGSRRVTAEALASQATLLRIEATRSVNETLRQWLGLAHDAEPWAALETLARLPLRWTADDDDRRADALVSLVGPLVFDVRRYRDGRGECSLSCALHPTVVARLRGGVLVPCLPSLPPTWNAKAAELCDRLDHRMMQELALRPHGGTAAGVVLDAETLVGQVGGPRYARKRGERVRVVRLLGLDGSAGLWTDDDDGGERRWLVSGDRYMPVDLDASAMLQEGWRIRVKAAKDGQKGRRARRRGRD